MSEIRPFVDALSGGGYSSLLVDAKDANTLEGIVPKCCHECWYVLLHFSIQIACSLRSLGCTFFALEGHSLGATNPGWSPPMPG